MIQVKYNDEWVTCDPALTWEEARKLWPERERREVDGAAWERLFECVLRATELVPVEWEGAGAWTPRGWLTASDVALRQVAQADPIGRMLGAAFAELMSPSKGRVVRAATAASELALEHTARSLKGRKP